MARTLLLVTTSDVDHGGCVECSTRAGTDTNADTGAANGLGRARVATDGSTVASRSGCGRSWVFVGRTGTTDVRTGLHREARVDHRHQGADRCSWVAIEVADRGVKIKLQRFNKIRRNVSLCERSHVAKLLGSVIGNQCLHRNILRVDAETISETLRQESEDLADGGGAAGDETVVQSVVESNLYKRTIGWLLWYATRRLDHARHVGREAGGRSRARAI